MTGPGTNVSQACAACKHQRRKCAPDCPLAPFFPPHRQAEFLNVHKLFGIRNIINTVNTVDPNQREIAVRAMIEEASLRVKDPVGGSCGIVRSLHEKCDQIKVELDMVLKQLAICRAKAKNGEVRAGVCSFYDDLMPPVNVALCSDPVDSVDKPYQISPRHHKISSKDKTVDPIDKPCNQISPRHNKISSKDNFNEDKNDGGEALQIGPTDKKGVKKVRNIDINIESPAEMEENDLKKPVLEDVKQHIQG